MVIQRILVSVNTDFMCDFFVMSFLTIPRNGQCRPLKCIKSHMVSTKIHHDACLRF